MTKEEIIKLISDMRDKYKKDCAFITEHSEKTGEFLHHSYEHALHGQFVCNHILCEIRKRDEEK